MKNGSLVGIFGMYRRRIINFAVPVDSVAAIGGPKDADLAHADSWAAVIKTRAALAGQEYWAIPRGRIIFRVTDGKFVIFASTSVVTDLKLLGTIARRFRLPQFASVQAFSDRHYDPPCDDLFED
jgi:hypothetical protein